jgi:replicative DNA helicase
MLDILDKVPPHDLDAEMAVLGAMFMDPKATDEMIVTLTPEAFYHQEHRKLFAMFADMRTRGVGVDLVTAKHEAMVSGIYEEVGGKDYLITLCDNAPTVANAMAYARIVLDKARLRELIVAAAEIIRSVHRQGATGDAATVEAEKRIFELGKKQMDSEARRADGVISEIIADVSGGRKPTPGFATGFAQLDKITGGFHAGELIVLGARTSIGKSLLGAAMAGHSAFVNRRPAAIFSLEMVTREICQRLVSSLSSVSAYRIKNGWANDNEIALMNATREWVKEAPLYIDDTPHMTIERLHAKVRRLVARYQIQLICVDYLQLVDGRSRHGSSRYEDVGNVSVGLKRIARDCGIAVLATAQLSRKAEEHAEPVLSDLRESGNLEQDADGVWLLHRAKDSQEAKFIVAKQRNGPVNAFTLQWQSDYVRFVEEVQGEPNGSEPF